MVRSEIDKVLFDTATLDSGDLFALLLLAPATFSMVNKLGSATGMITVTLSKEVARSPKATAPIYVDASKSAFDPKDIQLASGQGRVFRCYRGGAMVARDRKTARTFRRLRGSRGRSGNGELGFKKSPHDRSRAQAFTGR